MHSSIFIVELFSRGQSIGLNINEISWSISRAFGNYRNSFHIGLTQKLQEIKSYNYKYLLTDTISIDKLKDIETKSYNINYDIGFTYMKIYNKIVQKYALLFRDIKNHSITTINDFNVRFHHKLVFGSYINFNDFLAVSFDADIIRHEPVLFENPTQTTKLGIELNIYDHLKLRTGFKKDWMIKNNEYISGGFGLSLWGYQL